MIFQVPYLSLILTTVEVLYKNRRKINQLMQWMTNCQKFFFGLIVCETFNILFLIVQSLCNLLSRCSSVEEQLIRNQ